MNKLTVEECKHLILRLTESRWDGKISIKEKKYLAALEIALPVLEQQEKGDDGWMEWKGGDCPLPKGTRVDVRLRDGSTELSAYAWGRNDDVSREFKSSYAGWAFWLDEGDECDIIAYRVVEQERERGEE